MGTEWAGKTVKIVASSEYQTQGHQTRYNYHPSHFTLAFEVIRQLKAVASRMAIVAGPIAGSQVAAIAARVLDLPRGNISQGVVRAQAVDVAITGVQLKQVGVGAMAGGLGAPKP